MEATNSRRIYDLGILATCVILGAATALGDRLASHSEAAEVAYCSSCAAEAAALAAAEVNLDNARDAYDVALANYETCMEQQTCMSCAAESAALAAAEVNLENAQDAYDAALSDWEECNDMPTRPSPSQLAKAETRTFSILEL